jgi:hypothetical protein
LKFKVTNFERGDKKSAIPIIFGWENSGYNNHKYFVLSGLFDANIGDSIFVSKGRFDFEFNPGSLNF